MGNPFRLGLVLVFAILRVPLNSLGRRIEASSSRADGREKGGWLTIGNRAYLSQIYGVGNEIRRPGSDLREELMEYVGDCP